MFLEVLFLSEKKDIKDRFLNLTKFSQISNPVCISAKGGRFEFLKKRNEIIPKSDASKLLFQSSNLDSNKTENCKSMLIGMKFFSSESLLNSCFFCCISL